MQRSKSKQTEWDAMRQKAKELIKESIAVRDLTIPSTSVVEPTPTPLKRDTDALG